MKLVAFAIDAHQQRIGVLEGDVIYDLRDLLVSLAKSRELPVLPITDFAGLLANPAYANAALLQSALDAHGKAQAGYALDQVKLLAPFAKGSKIIAIGRNYHAHAKELGNEVPTEPMYFAKLASCIIAPGEYIELPPESQRVDYEGELAVVIGKQLRKAKSHEEALSAVFGYTIANDVTARDLQKAAGAKGQPWTRAKNYDTFCPFGPCIVTANDFSADAVELRTTVNGELKQQGNTRDLIFPVGELLRYVSQHITLEPGDVILTGTPEGVSPIHEGDTVSVAIDGIGTLTNPVRSSVTIS